MGHDNFTEKLTYIRGGRNLINSTMEELAIKYLD